MREFLKFIQEEDGAVTVDWVVLTAAIVGLGVLVVTTVANGALDTTSGLTGHINAQTVTTSYGG